MQPRQALHIRTRIIGKGMSVYWYMHNASLAWLEFDETCWSKAGLEDHVYVHKKLSISVKCIFIFLGVVRTFSLGNTCHRFDCFKFCPFSEIGFQVWGTMWKEGVSLNQNADSRILQLSGESGGMCDWLKWSEIDYIAGKLQNLFTIYLKNIISTRDWIIEIPLNLKECNLILNTIGKKKLIPEFYKNIS